MNIFFLYLALSINITDTANQKTITIYALPYFNSYPASIDSKDFLNMYELKVEYNSSSTQYFDRLDEVLSGLVPDTSSSVKDFHDFRAMIVIKKKHQKDKYWITSSGYIIYRDIVYEQNSAALASLLSLVPDQYKPSY